MIPAVDLPFLPLLLEIIIEILAAISLAILHAIFLPCHLYCHMPIRCDNAKLELLDILMLLSSSHSYAYIGI